MHMPRLDDRRGPAAGHFHALRSNLYALLSRYTGSMNLRKLVGAVFALLLMACAASAQAQLGVYGTYTASRLSGMTCLDPQGQCSSSNGEVNTTGGWGGVFYDFKSFGPVRFGVDVRAGEGHSNKSAVSSAGGSNATSTQNVLAGIRASFPTPIHILRPYAEVAAGWARSDATEPFGTSTGATGTPVPPRQFDSFLEYQGMVGADLRILTILDLRIIELGIGNMNRIGSGNGVSSVGVKSAGIGVVFHLPQR